MLMQEGKLMIGGCCAQPCNNTSNPKKDLIKRPSPLLLQPPLVLHVSTLARAGRRVTTRFCDFVASWVVSVQKQSTGEKRQPISQQEGLAIRKKRF